MFSVTIVYLLGDNHLTALKNNKLFIYNIGIIY